VTAVADFAAKRSTNGAGDSEPWPDPEPFDALDLPTFPVDAFSPWLRNWTLAEAQFAQVPVDLPAAIALAAASLAVARRFDVRVRGGWGEPCNLWVAVAMPPGERKSPIFAHATQPAYDFAKAEAERLGPHIAKRDLDRRVLTGQIAAAESAAVKHKPYEGGDEMQAGRELVMRLADLPEIHAPTLLADDTTAEALAVILAENGERIGLFSAEGGPFELMAGRYSERGTNFEIFLKAHAGDHHQVHRIKRAPIFLERPLVTMVLTVQPSVIQGLSGKDGFRGRGLLARFLFSLPQTALGRRAVNTPEVPPEVTGLYSRALRAIFEIRGPGRSFEMSPEADAARGVFQAALEPRLGPDGDLSPIADWAGKLTGTVCRLAGVLQVADHALEPERMPGEIRGETFQRAVVIGDYFLEHAVGAFGAMGLDDETALAKRTWAWIRRRNVGDFTEREALRAVHSTVEAFKPALAQLVERNLVRKRPAGPPTGGRPASESYDVNPRART
jgi:replicative DNA helicase